MKSYREIADSVFARREQYMIAQRKKKQVVARATVSVGSVALVSLAGFALWGNDAFHDTPPVTHGVTTTTVTVPTTDGVATVTTAPSATSGGDTTDTTAATDAPTQTVTTAPTTTRSKTTATTVAPTKTDPSKTTATTTAPKKVLITGDEPDDEAIDASNLSRNEKYISNALRQKMELYENMDVTYAVIVSILPMREDRDEDPGTSTEDQTQYRYECYAVFNAFFDEAKVVNPSWDGENLQEINKWTDTMRANYERWRTLSDKLRSPYVESILEQRYEMLKTICGAEPIDVLCTPYLFFGIECHGYYVELTADEISALAEQGGYTFRLASGENRDVLIDQ